MKVPHITIEQSAAIHHNPIRTFSEEEIIQWMTVVNALIDKANAEQSAEQAQYEKDWLKLDREKEKELSVTEPEADMANSPLRYIAPNPVTQIDKTTNCPCNRKWADCTACKSNFLMSDEEHRAQVWAAKLPKQEITNSAQPESEFITAAQARELGAGGAEFRRRLRAMNWSEWYECDKRFDESNEMWEVQYRAIKKAQPEADDSDWFYKLNFICRVLAGVCPDKRDMQTALEMARSLKSERLTAEKAQQPITADDVTESVRNAFLSKDVLDEALATAFNAYIGCKEMSLNQRIGEPADKHAKLRAEYAKQVAEGTVKFYKWECKPTKNSTFENLIHPIFFTLPEAEYRCTDISCYVSKDGEPAIRMLIEDAQELQARLGNTVEWETLVGYRDSSVCRFDLMGTYNYRTKPTIKLDGVMVTLEQAKAKLEAKKDTHDVYVIGDDGKFRFLHSPNWWVWDEVSKHQYELRPKAKIVKRSALPAGVAVLHKETKCDLILQGVTYHREALVTKPKNLPFDMAWIGKNDLALAPADKQPWMYWGGGECPVPEGCAFEITSRAGHVYSEDEVSDWTHTEHPGDIIAYRITGLQEGWKMEGAV